MIASFNHPFTKRIAQYHIYQGRIDGKGREKDTPGQILWHQRHQSDHSLLNPSPHCIARMELSGMDLNHGNEHKPRRSILQQIKEQDVECIPRMMQFYNASLFRSGHRHRSWPYHEPAPAYPLYFTPSPQFASTR